MPSIWVREFSGGLDTRRLPETSSGGTLLRGVDGHINSGGEFVQRSDFVQQHTLPAGQTRGLVSASDGLYVFGHQATAPAPLPEGVKYQRLPHPTGQALADVPYSTLYRARPLVVAQFVDGSKHIYYDGARITDANAPPNANALDQPAALLTFQAKVFAAGGATLYNSAVGAPTDFGAGAGSGSATIEMSTHAEGAERITGLARYDEFVAVFSRHAIQIWFFDPDPALSRQVQVLNNTGTLAPRSVTQFGDGDVFYLDKSGVRSLRARDSSNRASTTDVGSAIDTQLRAAMTEAGLAGVAKVQGLIEPRGGRFWLLIGSTIYVFSYFPASQISAWTTYEPAFAIDHMLVHDEAVWLRSGDVLYTYGDKTGTPIYAAAPTAECWLPYLDADEPTRAKSLLSVDAALRGTWEVRVGFDPLALNTSDLIGRIEGSTFRAGRVRARGQFNHVSVRFRAVAPPASGPAVVSSCVLTTARDREEDGR